MDADARLSRLFVRNLRLGFATNSSSLHSPVILPAGFSVETQWEERDHFGWEWFVLGDPESKAMWLGSQIAHALRDEGIPHSAADRIVRGWFPERFSGLDRLPDIDHQSLISLPSPSRAPAEFLRDFMSWADNPRNVVRGGNDNDEEPDGDVLPAGWLPSPLSDLPTDAGRGAPPVRLRKDFGHWTLFDAANGTKVRFSPDPEDPCDRSETPELADLKITDHCAAGCSFCYQGSTPRGRHAPLSSLLAALDMLAAMETFEVALGGGEPLDHPDLAAVLDGAIERGIVPNLTTYALDRLTADPELAELILLRCGGVGVSVHSPSDMSVAGALSSASHSLRYAKGGSNLRTARVMAQHALGSLPLDETLELIRSSTRDGWTPLLLLGWKSTGRGCRGPVFDATEIGAQEALAEAVESSHVQLSIDTSIVERMPLFLSRISDSPILACGGEGRTSCWIDAVHGVMAPSSYADPSLSSPFPSDPEAAAALFRSWSEGGRA